MTATPIDARLRQILADCVTARGLDLEEVGLSPAGKRRVLRIAVDKDDGVSLDEVAEATRDISAALDATNVMGNQPYLLEVGSRGTSSPLTEPRHWRRNTGRLVKVVLADGQTVHGRIATGDDDGATVTTDAGEQMVAYADVRTAKVQVELNRKDT